ncbi:MAG: hypothetical protein AB9903_11630 [Vulcanimicrobiota bacterium]
MHYFYGSTNSRYFAAVKNQQIKLFHDDRVMWSTELPPQLFHFVGIGNNGCVVIKLNEGLFIFRPGEKPTGEAIKKLSTSAFQKTGSTIDHACLDNEGSLICIQKTSPKSKVTEKIFGALASTRSDKGLKEYELLIYDIPTQSIQSLFKVIHPVQLETYFRWSISRDFNYFLVANPKKVAQGVSVKYSIIERATQKTLRSFELEDTEVENSLISSEGTALLEASKRGVRNLLIVTKDAYNFNLVHQVDSRVLHLARSFVAFQTTSPSALMAKSFDGKELCNVPLKVLDDLRVEYGILFNARDHIDFVYLKDNQLNVYRSELSTFLTEVKRCEILHKERYAYNETPIEISSYMGKDAPSYGDYSMSVTYSDDYEAPAAAQSRLSPYPPIEEDMWHEKIEEEESSYRVEKPAPRPIELPTKRRKEHEFEIPERTERPSQLPLSIEPKRKKEEIELPSKLEKPAQIPLGTGTRKPPSRGDEPLEIPFSKKDGAAVPQDRQDRAAPAARVEKPVPEAPAPPPEKLPDKMTLYQSLENIKLQLVMGIIEESEYKTKKQKIEQLIDMHNRSAVVVEKPQTIPDMEKVTSRITADDGAASGAPPTAEDAQRQKIQKLLESLEERFILGEVNEESYRELKAKYLRSLSAIRYQASPSQTSKDNIHSFGKKGLF